MSDLQISLIAIGALIIVAVLIINWWQERQFHRQVEDSFSPIRSDVLLDESDLEDPLQGDTLIVGSDKLHDTSNDDRFTDNFIIDSALLETTKREPSFADQDNRYLKPSQNFDDDTVLSEEVSIDAAYDEIINTKLERLSNQRLEASNTPQLKTKTDSNPVHPYAPKEALTNVLNSDKQYEPPVETGTLATKQNDLESELSLPAMLHGQMDLTAVLYLASKTSMSKLNHALKTLFESFDKPVFVHVLVSKQGVLKQDTNQQWHLLQDIALDPGLVANPAIIKVACSMQLADRGGAVSRNTLNRFQLAVETLGLDIDGHVEWQYVGDALAKANALDVFCIEVDKTIGFHLQHGENGAFTGTKLRGLAEAQGFKLNSDGKFTYIAQPLNNEVAPPSFVMFNREDYPFSPEMLRNSVVKAVTFQLDIPHVNQCSEAFGQMVQVARQMEIGLNAVLVDDSNKILGDIQIEKIRQQLKVIQATMLVRGIVPGSDSARRLFS
ncbi:MAG: cell division protein ZipA C-terminal FtsZ-binding domain-containing protein [Methylotenera sp.]|nr:cell division protein ZipA C-terminal FtsZ-binding domain-containing protein [Methylotenera sp.]